MHTCMSKYIYICIVNLCALNVYYCCIVASTNTCSYKYKIRLQLSDPFVADIK